MCTPVFWEIWWEAYLCKILKKITFIQQCVLCQLKWAQKLYQFTALNKVALFFSVMFYIALHMFYFWSASFLTLIYRDKICCAISIHDDDRSQKSSLILVYSYFFWNYNSERSGHSRLYPLNLNRNRVNVLCC